MRGAGSEELREENVGALMKRLAEDVALLVRQELELAKVEILEKGREARQPIEMFSAAAVAGLLALGAFTVFLIFALSLVVVPWLAALIVTVAYAATGAILAMTGKKKIEEAGSWDLPKTVETIKEDVQWGKTQIKSGTK